MKEYPVSFWVLIITEALLTAGYAMSFPFLAIYLSSVKRIPVGEVGFFLSLSMFIASISNVFGGELSDSYGRKKVMISSLLFRSFLIFAMSISIKLDVNPYVFFILHPLGLFVGSFFDPAARAYVADITEPQKRMRAYSLMRISTNAGWAAGPAFGGFIAASSYDLAFTISAVVYMICFIILYLMLKEGIDNSHNTKEKSGFASNFSLSVMVKTISKDKNFAIFCFFSFIISSVMSQLVVPVSMYSKKYLLLEEKQIGMLFTLNGAMVVCLQYFISKSLSKYPLTFSLAAGSIFYGIGYFMFGFSVFYYMTIISMIIVTLGEIMVSPGLQTLSANMARNNLRGRYMGIHSMLQQIGNSFGIFVGSLLIEKFAHIWAPFSWTFMLILSFFASWGFLWLGAKIREERIDIEENLIFEKHKI